MDVDQTLSGLPVVDQLVKANRGGRDTGGRVYVVMLNAGLEMCTEYFAKRKNLGLIRWVVDQPHVAV